MVDKKSEKDEYVSSHASLPFEDILRKFRKKNIVEKVRRFSRPKILEIGCGHEPLFTAVNDFEKFVIIEPRAGFCEIAKAQIPPGRDVEVIEGFVENIKDRFKEHSFDLIYIGGFLHEIDNPAEVLNAVKVIASKESLVYTWVPNARSMHRLLAFESGILNSYYEESKNDMAIYRKGTYVKESLEKLFREAGFHVAESGSYFVKPFSHSQMACLLEKGIIEDNVIEGFDKLIKYMPDYGAELFVCCDLKDVHD